jgi:two-component system phosphate regulon sensor histidine kinase PhoR
MKKRSIFWQILFSFVAVSVALVVGLGLYFTSTIKQNYYAAVEKNLLAQARLIESRAAPLVAENRLQAVRAMCLEVRQLIDARVTVVLRDGRVIGDSSQNPDVMDNHADRPEISYAMDTMQRGMSVRYSNTLGTDMMYVAVPMMINGRVEGVVRTSMPLIQLKETYGEMRSRVIAGLMVALVLVTMMSLIISHSIWNPLRRMKQAADHFATGDFNLRVPLDSSEEVSALADSMNWMAAQLDEKISTIRQQQYEQDAIIASMEEGVIALDTTHLIISMNEAAADMLGTTIKQSIGKPIEEVTRQQVLYDLVRQVDDGANKTVEADVTMYDNDEVRFFQVHATSLQGVGRNVFGVLLVLNDVTRLRRLENMRREFVANVSHELKTPVTSIKGFVETLMDNQEDPDVTRRFLEIVSRQTERLNAIIEDLMNLSRIERDSEHGDVTFERASVMQTIDAAILFCRAETESRKISVSVDCREDIALNMNAELIEQALVNLITNAAKYSESGSHVTVQVRQDEEASAVRIAVMDEGCGIAKQHIPRLFERFYRVDRNRSRSMGGTGLGLAIVKHIVRAHGGRIEVQSEVGKGSTFTVVISH